MFTTKIEDIYELLSENNKKRALVCTVVLINI